MRYFDIFYWVVVTNLWWLKLIKNIWVFFEQKIAGSQSCIIFAIPFEIKTDFIEQNDAWKSLIHTPANGRKTFIDMMLDNVKLTLA